jgi:hypothetical protein
MKEHSHKFMHRKTIERQTFVSKKEKYEEEQHLINHNNYERQTFKNGLFFLSEGAHKKLCEAKDI